MMVVLFLFILLVADAGEVTLPVKNEKVYAVQQVPSGSKYLIGRGRLYDLKVKLKPKIGGSRAYWRGRKKINLPLIILDKELLGTDSFEDWSDFCGF